MLKLVETVGRRGDNHISILCDYPLIFFVRKVMFLRLIGKRGGERVTKHDFETMYQRHFTGVYRYLVSLCKNPDLAEELTSETFFKAIKGLDKFDEKCSINSWLCQIAKYSYYDYLRKNQRLIELDSLLEQEDDKVNIEKQIVDLITSKEVYRKLGELEEPYKKVFVLRIFYELGFKQIAGIFGKTENWACVTFYRARKKLKERMGE